MIDREWLRELGKLVMIVLAFEVGGTLVVFVLATVIRVLMKVAAWAWQ